MACDCHAESLIGPVTPLIVAEALVNVTVPKFAKAATLPPTVGASTIHSAELISAVGLCVAAELSYVVNESLARLLSVIDSSKSPAYVPELRYWTEAVIESPGSIVMPEMGCSGCPFPVEYISHHAWILGGRR